MNLQFTPSNRNHTDQQLLADLRKSAAKFRKNTITVNQYRETGRYDPSTITSRFGSWSAAIEKAGLVNTCNRNISQDDLFENLMKVWILLGRQPYVTDMLPPISQYSKSPYKRMFGRWSVAIEKFVEYTKRKNIQNAGPIFTYPESLADRNAPTLHITKRNINLRLRHIILQRDHYKCKACGSSPATNPEIILHIDHIIPWAKGGETLPENLLTLCSLCNLGKSNL